VSIVYAKVLNLLYFVKRHRLNIDIISFFIDKVSDPEHCIFKKIDFERNKKFSQKKNHFFSNF
jgi:hypothetical protein